MGKGIDVPVVGEWEKQKRKGRHPKRLKGVEGKVVFGFGRALANHDDMNSGKNRAEQSHEITQIERVEILNLHDESGADQCQANAKPVQPAQAYFAGP